MGRLRYTGAQGGNRGNGSTRNGKGGKNGRGVAVRGPVLDLLSLNFVWVTLAAWKIWHEPVTTRHWLGVGLIITGIFILGSAV